MTVWLNEFHVGTNLISNFNTLNTVFATPDPLDPDCVFREFGASHDNSDGSRTGIGFPSAVLTWAAMEDEQVEILKSFCSGLSALVYWRIPTNRYDTFSARIWRTYLCQMLWMPAGEDKQSGKTLSVTIDLRHLIVQTEAT